jgi:RecJ-like exonuclease
MTNETCAKCKGKGSIGDMMVQSLCPDCNGNGFITTDLCAVLVETDKDVITMADVKVMESKEKDTMKLKPIAKDRMPTDADIEAYDKQVSNMTQVVKSRSRNNEKKGGRKPRPAVQAVAEAQS